MTAPTRLHHLLTATLLLVTACGPAAEVRPPDLILVVVDTLRADHLSTYGYHRPTSPVLDAVAADGVVFEDVTAQSSWTQPSMASLLTGRHLFANANRLPSAAASLAERLQGAGYETVAFVGNPNVSHLGEYDRGFDTYITREDTGGQTWDALDLEGAVREWYAAHPPGDAPRLYYLHYFDPHWPYEPRASGLLPGRPTIDADVRAAWDIELPDTPAVAAARDSDRESILADLDAYDHEIAESDASLGRLLELIGQRDHGLVFSADHGECLWERRHHKVVVDKLLEAEGRDPAEATLRDLFFRDHSYHMFRELLFTPLVAMGPGLPAGARCATPVENIDILPTLLRMAGLPDDPELDGHALQDVVAGAVSREVVYAHSKEATVVRQLADGAKLIFPTDTGFYFDMPIMQFDLGADPDERHNLWGQDTEAMRHLTRLHGQALSGFHLFDNESFSVDSDEQRALLKSLGYVGEGFEGPPPPRPQPADDHGSASKQDPTDTPPGSASDAEASPPADGDDGH